MYTFAKPNFELTTLSLSNGDHTVTIKTKNIKSTSNIQYMGNYIYSFTVYVLDNKILTPYLIVAEYNIIKNVCEIVEYIKGK